MIGNQCKKFKGDSEHIYGKEPKLENYLGKVHIQFNDFENRRWHFDQMTNFNVFFFTER